MPQTQNNLAVNFTAEESGYLAVSNAANIRVTFTVSNGTSLLVSNIATGAVAYVRAGNASVQAVAGPTVTGVGGDFPIPPGAVILMTIGGDVTSVSAICSGTNATSLWVSRGSGN